MISSEANYFLARIYYENESKIDSSLYHYGILTKEYPKNLIYLYYELKAMIKAKLPKQVLLEKKQKAIQLTNKNPQLILNQSVILKIYLMN